LARAKAGNNKLAKMAMMAITTSNSMSVNPLFCFFIISLPLSILHPSCEIAANSVINISFFMVLT
jgi:hypothetical protein